jgi:hypothetical protein
LGQLAGQEFDRHARRFDENGLTALLVFAAEPRVIKEVRRRYDQVTTVRLIKQALVKIDFDGTRNSPVGAMISVRTSTFPRSEPEMGPSPPREKTPTGRE